MKRLGLWGFAVAALAAWLSGCSATGGPDGGSGLTPDRHTFFPIAQGVHAMGTDAWDGGTVTCDTCHTTESFSQFDCISCHTHPKSVTDRLHTSVAEYVEDAGYRSEACFACHPTGEQAAFDHAGITGGCAECHDVGAPFAALPVQGFVHPDMGGNDCGACHTSFVAWDAGTAGVTDSSDPAHDLTVNALQPNFAGPVILSVNPLVQLLPMGMNHSSSDVPAAGLSTCTNCHVDAPASYFPGLLHSSLGNLMLGTPTGCKSCHTPSQPRGFVGSFATNPARTPATGEMRHDAVAWSGGAPTANRLVTQDCTVCHTSPTEALAATWSSGPAAVGNAKFHASLAAASLAQPGSCIDCHANSRPVGLLSSADAGVPAGISFDHQSPTALDDCGTCHAASAPAFATWTGGRFHLAGAANPASCLPCHEGQRPNGAPPATASFMATPFDFATNSRNITHGAGQDCAVCHPGPGSGAWGSTQNWLNGRFTHGANTLSANSCIGCHTTQRPDLLPGLNAASAAALLGFDHSINGSGDCYGCHQATVTRGSYGNLYNPSGNLPADGGWSGGVSYPGSTFVASLTRSISVTETRLLKTGALVTGTSSSTATYFNGMNHTSAALPTELNAGPTGSPDNTKCWHCHTHDAGVVTRFDNGVYHSALTNYRATVGGALAPFPQPTTRCNDCHVQMRPSNIVMRAANDLLPMDHNAPFTGNFTIGGVTTNNANGLDCSRCHQTAAGTTWADGQYHARIATAVPQDCVSCHYPLMANAARSDVTSGTQYAMRHRSGQITSQACATCHTQGLTKSTQTPAAAALWQPGTYHSTITAQPGACLECHAVSDPTAATQSSVLYTFAGGGSTATNRGQWMRHSSGSVVGKDCAVCHAADAKTTGSAWSKATVLHRAGVTTPTCRECHGTTNGGGTTPGTNNNLPAGLTNSQSLSPVSSVPNSGVPAGTYAQITHADVNVSARDCNFCHTQAGVSTVVGVQGKEWAQAAFHVKFNAANPLLMNGTTGRCSNCHMNVKPGAAYTAYNHGALTAASGTTDCASCHSWPGTGTATAPNWKGAVGGAPVNISVGGFNVSSPPAPNATTVQQGINNLPHPAGTCASCHTGGTGGKNAFGYDHALAPNSQCAACHEAGSNLVGTVWNPAAPGAVTIPASCGEGGGSIRDRAGDTRAIGLSTIACGDKASTKQCGGRSCALNHFYPADCRECHTKPAAGIRTTSTGTAYAQAWRFPHTQSNMQATTCCMCHDQKTNGCRP